MADRKDYYHRQQVLESELDAGFDGLEVADRNLAADHGLVGIVKNASVVENSPTPDLTVDVDGPSTVYDQQGQRIHWLSAQNVDLSQDSSNVSTEVTTPGHERWISVFAKFDRALTDARTDGNDQTVFFDRAESFQFVVKQAATETAPATTRPPLESDAILLADVKIANGTTQILNADINLDRREMAFVLTGAAPANTVHNNAEEAAQSLANILGAHVTGAAHKHDAADIDAAARTAWLGGETNPAADVQTALDKVVTDLSSQAAGDDGAEKVGAEAYGTLSSGSVRSQVNEIEDKVGKLPDTTASDDGASKVGAQASGTLSAGTVRSQLDELDTAVSGFSNQTAAEVNYAGGGTWADGSTNPATTVEGQLDKNITDLSAQTASNDGAAKIGAEASGELAAGTVRSQLDELEAGARAETGASVPLEAAQAEAGSNWSYVSSNAGGGLSRWINTSSPGDTTEELTIGVFIPVGAVITDVGALVSADQIGAGLKVEFGYITAPSIGTSVGTLDNYTILATDDVTVPDGLNVDKILSPILSFSEHTVVAGQRFIFIIRPIDTVSSAERRLHHLDITVKNL